MSHLSNKFWTLFALPASLLILASAYYIRVGAVRRAVDAHTVLARRLLGRFVSESSSTEGAENATHPSAPAMAPGSRPGPATTTPPGAGAPATNVSGVVKPETPRVFDLQDLARDRSLWPKKLTLKKPTTFPAVVGGKVVGNIVAPIGAEANLKAIKDGQVGLEFEGGGAWVAVEDTDLSARVPMK